MASKLFQWHERRILKQIAANAIRNELVGGTRDDYVCLIFLLVNHAVRYDSRTIVGSRSKERVAPVEGHGSDAQAVMPERLVRFRR